MTPATPATRRTVARTDDAGPFPAAGPGRFKAIALVLHARASKAAHAFLAWRMAPLLARCAIGALGLVLLAGIGRSALAGGGSSAAPTGGMLSGAIPQAVASPTQTVPSPPAASATSPPAVASPEADGGATTAATSNGASASTGRRATPDDPVYLNQAAFEDLRRLPGVGPKRAQAILALRQRLGRFRQIEDLLKVKGIGRSTLRKLRPLVRLESPTGGS